MTKQIHFLIATILLVFLTINGIHAQKWTGNGDGTTWNDPANWEPQEVPQAGALIKFSKNANLTGIVPANPGQIKVFKNITVTFDLNLTIGDGTIAQHALTIGPGSTVNFGTDGNNRVIIINTPLNKHRVAVFNGSDDVTINIAKSTTFIAKQTQFGINIYNINSKCVNNGKILLDSLVTTGIKTAGTFINNGEIIGTNVKSNGIIVAKNGKFENDTTGIINITVKGDDAIELLEGSYFKNAGNIIVVSSPSAYLGNFALVLNTPKNAATFINDNHISIAGTSDTSRIFKIDTMGIFENNGTIDFNGPAKDSMMVITGKFNNNKNAYLNLTSGGMAVTATGEFTNAGLFTIANEQNGLFTKGHSVNNGFYNYASGKNFSQGVGEIVDNGLPAVTTVDANKECTIDLAEESYEWFIDDVSFGESEENGNFSFPENSLESDSVVMTTSLEGVNITVINICEDAITGCGTISKPVSLGEVQVCFGEEIPALKVEEVSGYVADWFESATSSDTLFTGTEYIPTVTEPGTYTYYVENREESSNCVSERIPVTLTIYALPQISADSTICADDYKTYTVYFTVTTEGNFVVTADRGTVSGNTVTGVEVDSTVTITVVNSNSNCSSVIVVEAPDCTSKTNDPLFTNSKLNIYPTISNGTELFVDVTNMEAKEYSIIFYDINGKIAKSFNVKGATNNKINVSELHSGMYFVELVTRKGILKSRILITH